MNKKDKDKILKLLIITGLIAVTVFFMFGLGRLSVQIILAVVVLLHCLLRLIFVGIYMPFMTSKLGLPSGYPLLMKYRCLVVLIIMQL